MPNAANSSTPDKAVLDFGLRNPVAVRTYKVASLVFFIGLWQALSIINGTVKFYNPLLIPSPSDIVQAAIGLWNSGALPKHIWASVSRVFMGVAIAVPPAVIIGIALARSRLFEVLFEPLIELIRPIPPLAVLPVFILWFGIGEASKLVFIAYGAFFVIMTTVMLGAANIDPVLIRASKTLGMTGWKYYRRIVFPAVSPEVFVGIRLGISAGFVVIVAAEFIAADVGLGYMVNYARAFFRVSDMFVGAFVIGFIGYAVNSILVMVEHRLFNWRFSNER